MASSRSSGIDHLSNLPDALKQKILALVPLKEAVRTSTLSTRWRRAWSGVTSLVIHEVDHGFRTLNGFIRLVYYLLANHTNYLDKFEFVFWRRPQWVFVKEDLEFWINVLLRKHVRELVLNLGYQPLEIPSVLFSLTELEVIHLRGCKINVPEGFDGFRRVHTLKLENIELRGIDIGSLVSSCPLLTHFLLHTEYEALDNLTIRSTSLLELKIKVEFKELHLETPKLVTLFVSLNEGFQDVSEIASKYENNIGRFMSCAPDIQEFNICWKFVQYLANGGVPEQLPVSLNHLTTLTVEIDCACTEHIDLVICLLQSAPNINKLRIELNGKEFIDPPYPSYWEEAGAIEGQFNQLKTVIVGGEFLDVMCIVAFVNFVLRSAPILEEVRIEKRDLESMESPTKFLMKLLELTRLSNKAIIKMIDL